MPPLLPINLYSDNVAVAAPEIMAALARVNAGPAQPYGIEAGLWLRFLAALHQPQLIMLARNVGAVEVDPRDQGESARDKRRARRAGDRWVADHADLSPSDQATDHCPPARPSRI